MRNLENLNVQEMNNTEIKNANGGGLVCIFLAGVAYGYVKEKFATDEWTLEQIGDAVGL